MRAAEHNTFRREIEIAEQERQEAKEQERQEQERLSELYAAAFKVLSWFNLEEHVERFIESADGPAILANCCNCAAKCFDCNLYDLKPFLVRLAAESHSDAWQDGGIVYIETCVGQVSFHALYGEDEGLPEANGRVWSEIKYQMSAPLVAKAFLEGRSIAMIHQQIAELDAATEGVAA